MKVDEVRNVKKGRKEERKVKEARKERKKVKEGRKKGEGRKEGRKGIGDEGKKVLVESGTIPESAPKVQPTPVACSQTACFVMRASR
jgi:hypothetical protein